MRAPPHGVWVLFQSRYDEFVVVRKSDYDHWAATYPTDYEFIAEGKYDAMQSIKKVIKEPTC